MTATEFEELLIRAVSAISGQQTSVDQLYGESNDLGLDSLGVAQVILFLEDETQQEIPEAVLDRLVDVETPRAFYGTLRAHYVSEAAT